METPTPKCMVKGDTGSIHLWTYVNVLRKGSTLGDV